MAELVYKNAHLTINAVDLSDHVRSLTLTHSAEMGDKTAMSNNSRRRIAGLKDWNIAVEFNHDFAAAKIDATLNGLVGAASFPIIMRPDAGAVSATNPQYTGSALLESYPVVQGGVGDAPATTSITMPGDGDLARATS